MWRHVSVSLLLSTSSIRSFHSWTRTLDCSSLHFVKFALAPIFALAKAVLEATWFELRGLSGSTMLSTFDDVLVVQTSHTVNKATTTRIRFHAKTKTFLFVFAFRPHANAYSAFSKVSVFTGNGDFRKRVWKWRLSKTETYENTALSCGTGENGDLWKRCLFENVYVWT